VRAEETLEQCVERLLHDFRTYDRTVDVVSSFEMVFTESQTDIPATVEHFERFPAIRVDGRSITPDFSVLFNDGSGFVGEIARIALADESVDSLCDQILTYDDLSQLPTAEGTKDVEYVDVLLLVPLAVGPATAIRVLEQRLDNAEHSYKPGTAPCVVQFAFDEGRYLFQRLPHSLNGMPRDGDRPDGLGRWFAENGDFRARPERIAHIKAARAFVNDEIEPLYLAVHLWAKTLATEAGGSTSDRPVVLTVRAGETAEALRRRHGRVRTQDVRRALELLERAKLAETAGDDTWQVGWEELRGTTADLAATLAERICRPPMTGPLARMRKREAVTRREEEGVRQGRFF
jgi:hypothetical protein